MPLIYRRARGSDTWHFRDDCTQWPEAGFEEAQRTPSEGVCCVECTYWSPWRQLPSAAYTHWHGAADGERAHRVGC